MRESSTPEAPEIAEHHISIWNRNGYIFYHCAHCRFLRVVDTYTGNYTTVNQGQEDAAHIGPGIRFQKEIISDDSHTSQ
jgi:hypothetical protein